MANSFLLTDKESVMQNLKNIHAENTGGHRERVNGLMAADYVDCDIESITVTAEFQVLPFASQHRRWMTFPTPESFFTALHCRRFFRLYKENAHVREMRQALSENHCTGIIFSDPVWQSGRGNG